MAAAARRKAGDVDALIGRNVRRIREALGGTQDELVQALRASGWQASSPTVMALERGERALLHEEVLLLADVLNVAVTELYAVDGFQSIQLGSLFPDSPRFLANRLTQAPRDKAKTWMEVQRHRRTIGFGMDTFTLESFQRDSLGYTPDDEATREAERHAAERLGISPDELVRRSYTRWGRTLSDERDARAAARTKADASPRSRTIVRGHVTRELLAELEQEPEAK
jgi:transcriptional regulator with XRE-family HTH domain